MPRRAKVRWHKGRSRWYANIGERDEKGRAREVFAPATIGANDEGAAWDWMENELARRAAGPSVQGEATVALVCEHYLAAAELRVTEGKLDGAEYANKRIHLGIWTRALGDRVVSTLTPEDMTAFAERLEGVYSATYARNVCSSARAAMNWAVRPAKLIPTNTIQGFKLPGVPQSPARFGERREAAVYLWHWLRRFPRESVRGRYDRFTLLLERCLVRTGARPKELCRLKWSDIQWQGWQTSAGHAAAKGVLPYTRWKAGKKTRKSRTIYFTPALTRSLRRILERGAPSEEWVFVHRAGRGGRGGDQPWSGGSRLSKTALRVRRELVARQELIRARLKRGEELTRRERWLAEVTVRDEGPDKLVNYRWRHTVISTLLMHGVDVATVAELTGTSPEMIYKHYGHLLDSHLQAAAEKLAASRIGRRA